MPNDQPNRYADVCYLEVTTSDGAWFAVRDTEEARAALDGALDGDASRITLSIVHGGVTTLRGSAIVGYGLVTPELTAAHREFRKAIREPDEEEHEGWES